MMKTQQRRSVRGICGLARSAAVLTLAVSLAAGGCGKGKDEKAAPDEKKPAAEEKKEEAEAAPGVVVVEPEAQKQVQLRTEPAAVRPLAAVVRTTAVIGPDETRVAHIRPLARGVVTRVHVRRGDRVAAGQTLISYDNVELGELVAEYRSAAADIDKATADADVTRRALERGTQLVELGSIARADFERRQAEDAAARAALNGQRARLASIRQKLRRFGVDDVGLQRAGGDGPLNASATLRAPFAGVVMDAPVAQGETIDVERELMTVTDLSTVWVQADVYERDLAAVSRGRRVQVFVPAYPDLPFDGRVTYVSDTLEPTSRTAKVRVEVANPGGRLKLEMAATVLIPTEGTRAGLAVPTAAVQRIDGEPVVFLRLDEERFQKRRVRLGREADGWAEVLEGLKAGDVVVTQGAVMLKSKLKIGEFAEEDEKK